MAGHGGHAVIFRFTSDFPNLKMSLLKIENHAVPHKRKLAGCIHRLQSCAALVASQRWLASRWKKHPCKENLAERSRLSDTKNVNIVLHPFTRLRKFKNLCYAKMLCCASLRFKVLKRSKTQNYYYDVKTLCYAYAN